MIIHVGICFITHLMPNTHSFCTCEVSPQRLTRLLVRRFRSGKVWTDFKGRKRRPPHLQGSAVVHLHSRETAWARGCQTRTTDATCVPRQSWKATNFRITCGDCRATFIASRKKNSYTMLFFTKNNLWERDPLTCLQTVGGLHLSRQKG